MTSRSAEIEALVKRLFAYRASGNSEAVVNLFSASDDFLAVGSEQGDWWTGLEARDLIVNTWARRPEESDEVVRLEAYESDSVGWAVVEGRRTRPELPPYSYHITLILRLEGGAWRVIYVQFSVLVSEEQVNRVELTPGLSDLLNALDSSHAASHAAAGMPRTGTVMFTDIVDSTARSQATGDRQWATTFDAHINTLRDIVKDCGGRVVKTLGDGAMLLFTSGTSAIEAAVRIQQDLATGGSEGIQIRVGIHTGDLMDSGEDLVGLTVNKAARVASAAEADQVLVSATTVGLVNSKEHSFQPPINAVLKGLDGTHLLYPLGWCGSDSRGHPQYSSDE